MKSQLDTTCDMESAKGESHAGTYEEFSPSCLSLGVGRFALSAQGSCTA